jgi:hypothetical protein
MARAGHLLLACGLAILATTPLSALEARMVELRAGGPLVHAVLELRDVFGRKDRDLVDAGGTLYVQIDAELWEDRPTWDRIVSPPSTTVFRILRDRARKHIALADPDGGVMSYVEFPDRLPLRLEVAPADRIQDESRYYLFAVATVGGSPRRGGTREVGDAVFGDEREASGLAAVGRFLFRTAQQISDYLQTASVDFTSRRMTGKQIKGGK